MCDFFTGLAIEFYKKRLNSLTNQRIEESKLGLSINNSK